MGAMTSFHAESATVWCVLMQRPPDAYAAAFIGYCPLALMSTQFLIHSTLVLVIQKCTYKPYKPCYHREDRAMPL